MTGWRIITTESRRAFDLRLLLLWLAAALLPTVIVALPLGGILRDTLDFSAHTNALAQRLNLDALHSLLARYQQSQGAVQSTVGFAWVCILLTAPLLNAWAANRYLAQKQSFARFLISGLIDYGRWFWLHLSAILIYLLGFGLAAAIAMVAPDRIEGYVDVRAFENAQRLGWLCAFLIAVATHFLVENLRAEYVCEPNLRWPPEALWRALQRRGKLKRLGAYLLTSLVGMALVLVFLLLRQHFSGAGKIATIATFLFAQCAVATLAWTRIARLFSLAALADLASATRNG